MTPEGRPETINDILHTLKGIKDPSKEFLETELKKQQDEFDANQYQRDRKYNYPNYKEQLDLMYWDKVNGTEKWKEAISAVKAKFPKP